MAPTASPTLKLLIEKGPREGETLEFNPISTVKIGRVVRGNNLPIKDAGISSKHISIEFNSNSCKWVITDLDSSNGTILNSSQLKALSPFELRNGDEIKVGECTSIRVEIVESGGEVFHRRNPSRRAPPKGGIDLGVKVNVVNEECPNLGGKGSVSVRDLEGEELQKGVDSGVSLGRENRKGRGRGRRKKESVLAEGNAAIDDGNIAVQDVKPKQERGVSMRRTRNSKREGEELMSLGESIPVRKTRSTKNLEAASENEAVLDGGGFKEVEIVAESKKTRGRGRKKKVNVECSDSVKDVLLEDMTIREPSLVKVMDVREQPHEEPMGETVQQHELEDNMTREVSQLEVMDVRKQPHEEEPVGDSFQSYVLEDNMIPKDSEPKAEEQVKCVLDAKGKPNEQPAEETVREVDNGVDTSHFDQAIGHSFESDMVLEDGRVGIAEIEDVSEELNIDADGKNEQPEAGNVPDLEKMTLGEWFDYLEVYFPKQIHAVTDEIIVDMRKRAKQFDDFMLQRQNERGKLPITT